MILINSTEETWSDQFFKDEHLLRAVCAVLSARFDVVDVEFEAETGILRCAQPPDWDAVTEIFAAHGFGVAPGRFRWARPPVRDFCMRRWHS
jgi:hypothetical protein